MAENGYASATGANEVNSKGYFWQILLILVKLEAEMGSQSVIKPREQYNKNEVLVIAYYLSKYDHEDLFPHYTQQQAIQELAEHINIKPNTLKNQRDFYDSHTGSRREGWKKPLIHDQKMIFDEMEALLKNEVIDEVRQIIQST